MPKTLISIIGPTAIGKTSLGIELAQKFNTDIISVDSRQFYQNMDIGTAKPSPEELKKIPHHFIDMLSVEENYSAGQFEKDALKTIEALFLKKDVLIAVGGSGLYIKALWEGLDEFPEIPVEIRKELNEQLENEGLLFLQNKLKTLDPEFYKSGEIQNPQRVIRALEVCLHSNKAFSEFKNQKRANRSFDILKIGLEMERKNLYERINQRVDQMLEAGLEKEAKAFYPLKKLNALQTVGYQEFFDYFDSKTTKEKAVELIKRNTRRYAKRQLTWFRNQEAIHWFHPAEKKQIFAFVSEKLDKF
ncbi:MAG: tRNA (adenosine(37)-N6)-dimethylallyltransferase MiaA [Chitinophagales bacterium]